MADEGTDVDLPGVDSGDCDDDSRWTPKLREGGSGGALSAGDAKAARDDDTPKTVIECPVCLQPCVHPVQLPCSHIFCFLCVKGVANRSKRCALCRQEIPLSFFHNPKLIRREELQRNSAFEDGFQWFYEGRNGWWQYDVRTSADLEDKFKAGETSFELLIAGFLYVIDLDSMLQYRRNDPTRRRRIKRDLENIPEKKGVAGLRTATTPANSRQGAYGVETDLASKRQTPQSGDCQQTSGTVLSPLSPPAPSNTPHNSQSPAVPGLSSMMAGLQISPGSDGTHPSSPSGASMATSSGQTSPSSLVPRALSRSPASPRNHQRSSTSASQRTGGTPQSQLSPRPRGNQQRLPRTQRAGRNDPAGDSRAPHALPVRRTRSSSSLHTPSGVSTGGMSTGGGSDGSQSRGAVQIRQRRRQTSNRENQSS